MVTEISLSAARWWMMDHSMFGRRRRNRELVVFHGTRKQNITKTIALLFQFGNHVIKRACAGS